MKKSKEFIVRRWRFISNRPGRKKVVRRFLVLSFLNGRCVAKYICYRPFLRFYGIKLAPGESKHIKITIEEVKT